MPSPPLPLPSTILRESFQGYRLGYVRRPTDGDLGQILSQLQQPPAKSTDPLKGRVQTLVLNLPALGKVVVKPYARGGWMRYLSRRLHIRSWTSRAEIEFRILNSLAASGVHVPQPLMWAETGHLLVHKWLITAEVPHAQTLAEIAQQDAEHAASLLPKVVAVVQSLIAREVHHIDFHPGNVLVDDQNQVYPIDFDKAAVVSISPADLAERYRSRWNRAIAKHQLPAQLHLTADALPSEI